MIDLGPPDAAAQAKLARALRDAGLEPLAGDGVEHALAGIASDRDTTLLAAAMTDAEHSFGKLDCAAATSAAHRALPVIAARQASGLAVPELPRAWAYLLLCADRNNDVDAAMRAAHGIRSATSGAPDDVSPAVLAKYPPIDTLLGSDIIDVDIATDDGATVWVDFQPVGTAPLRVALAAGEHMIAAAKGSRRGSVRVTATRAVPAVTVALEDQRSPWTAVAAKVASWRGNVPKPDDLGWVLKQVRARIALVRHGDIVEAWGHAGPLETPRRFGDDSAASSLDEANRAAALLAETVREFDAHSPDADQPLLVDDIRRRRAHGGKSDEPATWWVYAAIGAAIAAGAAVVYLQRSESNVEHVELHYP